MSKLDVFNCSVDDLMFCVRFETVSGLFFVTCCHVDAPNDHEVVYHTSEVKHLCDYLKSFFNLKTL